MKIPILGIKEKTDTGYDYFSYQQNMSDESLPAKSRKLLVGKNVKIKRFSIYPVASLYFFDFEREDYNLTTKNACILLVDTDLSKETINNINLGSMVDTRFNNQKVKLIKEVENPFDLDFLEKYYFSYISLDNHHTARKNAEYDIIGDAFTRFCNESNKESFKELIRDYTFYNESSIDKYGIDFSVSDNNFIIWKWLVDYKEIMGKEGYQVTFGRDGSFNLSNKSFKSMAKEKDIDFKYLKYLPKEYLYIVIKMLPDEYTRNLSKQDKIYLYYSLYADDDNVVSLVENGKIDINDLFKTAWNNSCLIDKYMDSVLRDRSYVPEKPDEEDYDYDDEYEYEDEDNEFLEHPDYWGFDEGDWYSDIIEDDQFDIIEDAFSWKDYLDKELLKKLSKHYAPRVKKMLLNKGWDN